MLSGQKSGTLFGKDVHQLDNRELNVGLATRLVDILQIVFTKTQLDQLFWGSILENF